MDEASFLPEFCNKEILILGCGNSLFGDDGFGPAVAEYLVNRYRIPSNVYVADTGTGVRKILFTLCVSPRLPKRIVLVDAVDKGRKPGEIFELLLEDVPMEKIDDFSMHQVPSSNLALTLRNAGVDVHVKVCQVERIPDSVEPGLTKAVAEAVPRMCEEIVAEHFL